jgi:aminoglycoside phosphotransferase (APT) family kinase protein
MSRLGDAGVPVPGVVAYASEPAIAGRSFMVVDKVAGVDWHAATRTLTHAQVARAAVDALRRLQEIDLSLVKACFGGQISFGPGAELERWQSLLTRADPVVNPEAGELQVALARTVPDDTAPVLVHGDYHYGNLMFRDGAVVAVLDWEIASLGERLVDVGSLIVASLRRRYAPEPNSAGSVKVSAATIAELHGAAPDRLPWFVALNCLKYVAIIGYNLRLHRTGRRVDPEYERLLGTVKGLVRDGLQVVREGLYAECVR